MLITGCLDCTCRIWSVKKGNLLFQINVPYSPRSIYVAQKDVFYVSSATRLLVFSFRAAKEQDIVAQLEEEQQKLLTEASPDPSNRFKDLITSGEAKKVAEGPPESAFYFFRIAKHPSLTAAACRILSPRNQEFNGTWIVEALVLGDPYGRSA
jgi:hypothetical protein